MPRQWISSWDSILLNLMEKSTEEAMRDQRYIEEMRPPS